MGLREDLAGPEKKSACRDDNFGITWKHTGAGSPTRFHSFIKYLFPAYYVPSTSLDTERMELQGAPGERTAGRYRIESYPGSEDRQAGVKTEWGCLAQQPFAFAEAWLPVAYLGSE